MKSDFSIYLAGAMTDVSFEESNKWRIEMKNALITAANWRSDAKISVINPNDYYNFEVITHDTEREIMDFDLYKVRHSNLILVNFDNVKSLGTMAEIAIAYENKIPIVGLNEKNENLHPWQIEMCNKIFTDKNKLVDYIVDYYLN